MLRHIFFDLDNTLMLSRTQITAEHAAVFKKLTEKMDVTVVSGAQASQIKAQIPESIGAHFYILGQTGNQALEKNGAIIWEERFSDEQASRIYSCIETIKLEFDTNVKDPNDLVENRGAQIAYSPIGHHENLDKKYAFDPGDKKRAAVIARHHAEIDALRTLGVDVVPGGTTCFDFFLVGKNKGFNVARFIENRNWIQGECVYVGDALFPGGNDASVIGIIETYSVKNPDDTFLFIEKVLAA